jgi:hypothetical protein
VATAKFIGSLLLLFASINVATFGMAKRRASKYTIPTTALQIQVPKIPLGAIAEESTYFYYDYLQIFIHLHVQHFESPQPNVRRLKIK